MLTIFYYLRFYWPTDVSVEAIVIALASVCSSGCLCVTTVNCGQTAQRIELSGSMIVSLGVNMHYLPGAKAPVLTLALTRTLN